MAIKLSQKFSAVKHMVLIFNKHYSPKIMLIPELSTYSMSQNSPLPLIGRCAVAMIHIRSYAVYDSRRVKQRLEQS